MTALSHPSRLYALPRRRAASLRQVLTQRLLRSLAAVWQTLEDAGQRRAAPQLLAQAELLQASQPELAHALRELATRCAEPQPLAAAAMARVH